MDQRRVVAFVALSFLVLMLNSMLVAPPPRAPKDLPPEQPEQQIAAEDRAVEAPAPVADQPDPPPGDVDVLPQEAARLEYLTLGSVADDSNHRMLVTFTTQGAGIRRIELASPRFRDLHDRGGYLGHLELTADPAGGIRVGTVGAGTPAAKAGLQPGDRIVSVSAAQQETTLESPADLADLLAKTKPGKSLALKIERGEEAPISAVVTLSRRPLEVIRPESENVLLRTDELPKGFAEPPSFQFTFEQLGTAKINKQAEEIAGVELRDSNWEVAEHNDTSVTFRQRLPKYQLEVLKRFRLESVPAEELNNRNYPGYGLTLELEVRNLGQDGIDFAYRLDGPNGLPVEGWWYANKIGHVWGAVGIRDVIARYVGKDTVQFPPTDIAQNKVDPLQGPPLAFIGIDAQYFSVVMLPNKPDLADIWIDESRSVLIGPKPKARSAEGRYANVTCRLLSHIKHLNAGETLRHSYDIFAGPKRPDLLAQYHASENDQYTLESVIAYGWFGGVAKVMLAVLHFFYGIVGNYGIAIIMLTVLVRSLMFPITRKQSQSMAKMQALKPEMDKLKEKYKKDMQKQSQAMQELYRKHNINPLAGCLPMFLQLPIFIGLYRSLMVDIELRQAPLFGDSIRWCSNLAAPDMFLDWSAIMPDFINSGIGFFALGPYLNVLPLAATALILVQQALFMPAPANEQAAMQQKIMKYMMIFMGILFFKFAAGLSLYFIASTTWAIAERKMLPKPDTAPGEPASAGGQEKKNFRSTNSPSNGQAGPKRARKKPKKRR